MGGVMPVQSPEPAEQVSTEPLSIPVQPMAFAAPDPAPGARVVCVESGPYLCYGASVQMGAGGVEAPKNGKPLALCACGRSSMKPFCDGSHAKGEPASEEPASEPAEVVELVAD
jgi:CDGSH-type Zn-finger protein